MEAEIWSKTNKLWIKYFPAHADLVWNEPPAPHADLKVRFRFVSEYGSMVQQLICLGECYALSREDSDTYYDLEFKVKKLLIEQLSIRSNLEPPEEEG